MPEGPEAHAVKSPRAYATRSPTMVSQDKPELSAVIIQHDLLYCYDTLLENVSDPLLIDFSHHKVIGRRDRAKPLAFKMESSGSWDFAGTNDGNPQISAEFVAPCYYMNKVEIDTKLPIVGDQEWIIWICSFNVPMAPGKIHSTVCNIWYIRGNKLQAIEAWLPCPQKKRVNVSHAYVQVNQEQHSVLEQFQDMCCEVVPRWHEHWTSNKLAEVTWQQSTRVRYRNEFPTAAIFNFPKKQNLLVLSYSIGMLSEVVLFMKLLASSKKRVLDRFEQHTQKWSSCKRAYEFQTLQKFLIVATVALAALALVSAGLAYTLNHHEKNFVFIDHVHAEID
ncbi:hypothetical protein POTOM_033836 [Populus tomentosa]|uniref:Uncharacterized protein n=1 Tax=Populus tomentosa TaxID=118781 RepID=A0A8X7Z127_POPTO|nr:hypothetical protein POTOM_033836 [Populus tomentosa]